MNKVVVVQYKEGWVSPKVLLKKRGSSVHKITKIAEEAGVPVIEDPVLLEDLWITEEGDFIKEELFQIMAGVLSFVYKLEKEEA